MRTKQWPLSLPGSLPESQATLYLMEDMPLVKKRPMVIVCPGGAYEWLSPREGEPVALQFMANGCHAAVMAYSTAPARFPTALLEVASLIKALRENASDLSIDPERIYVLGFSAGGHLAASYGVLWHEAWVAEAMNCPSEKLRPNGMILCYPVITSGKGGHEGSFRNLLGDRYNELKASLSLENRVSKNTPPAFIWHTGEDETVPVINSLKMVEALTQAGVPVEFHLFPRGRHGMALCSGMTQREDGGDLEPSAAQWMPLCLTWLQRK